MTEINVTGWNASKALKLDAADDDQRKHFASSRGLLRAEKSLEDESEDHTAK